MVKIRLCTLLTTGAIINRKRFYTKHLNELVSQSHDIHFEIQKKYYRFLNE